MPNTSSTIPPIEIQTIGSQMSRCLSHAKRIYSVGHMILTQAELLAANNWLYRASVPCQGHLVGPMGTFGPFTVQMD
jgi:hypothetical protein